MCHGLRPTHLDTRGRQSVQSIHHHFVYGASSLALAGPPFNTTAVTLDVGVWIVAPLDTPRHGEVPSSWRGDEKPRFGCSAGFAPAGEIPDLVNGR